MPTDVNYASELNNGQMLLYLQQHAVREISA